MQNFFYKELPNYKPQTANHIPNAFFITKNFLGRLRDYQHSDGGALDDIVLNSYLLAVFLWKKVRLLPKAHLLRHYHCLHRSYPVS